MAILVVLLGYLLGSISSAYLAGRWLKGIDLREYGSGTVSGTGVYEHVGMGAMVAVGLFDIAKGAFPTWLGLRWGLPVALAAGLAAIVGHNWPLYLKFKGGRGLGTSLGVLAIVFPWGAVLLLIILGLGRLLRYTALVALVGVAALPLLSWLTGQPGAVTWACLALLFLVIAKRLEANRLPLPPPSPGQRRVLMRRFLFDRDVGVREPWTERTPKREKGT